MKDYVLIKRECGDLRTFAKIYVDDFVLPDGYSIEEGVTEEDLEDVIFMTLKEFKRRDVEGVVEQDVLEIVASYTGYLIARELFPQTDLFTMPKSPYLTVPVGPIELCMKLERSTLQLPYLKYFPGAVFVTEDEYKDSVVGMGSRALCVDKKTICMDNFGRDNVSDCLLATGVYCKENPDMLVSCLNTDCSEDYFELVNKDYELYKFEY